MLHILILIVIVIVRVFIITPPQPLIIIIVFIGLLLIMNYEHHRHHHDQQLARIFVSFTVSFIWSGSCVVALLASLQLASEQLGMSTIEIRCGSLVLMAYFVHSCICVSVHLFIHVSRIFSSCSWCRSQQKPQCFSPRHVLLAC